MDIEEYLGERLGHLFSRAKLPGWAIIALWLLWEIFIKIPELHHAVEWWLGAAESLGGHMPQVVAVITSWWFSVGLLCAGVGYLAFVGEPQQQIRHPLAPIIGWGIFGVVAVAFGLTAFAGFIVTRIDQNTAADVVGLKEKNKQLGDQVFQLQAQTSDLIAQLVPRGLTPLGRVILFDRLKTEQEKGTQVIHHVYVTPLDREAYDYAQQIIDAFVGAGWVGNSHPEYLGLPIPAGIRLAVKNVDQVPALTKSVRDFLQEVGVRDVEIVPVAEDERENSITLLIGPRPRQEQNVTK